MNLFSLKKNLMNYLSDEIKIYSNICSMNNKEFQKYFLNLIDQRALTNENLIKLFYFNRFFSLIYEKEIKSKVFKSIPLNQENSIINEIENHLLNSFLEEKCKDLNILNKYFITCGKYRKSFLKKFHDYYIQRFSKISDCSIHQKIMETLMICDFEGEWEKKCFEIIKEIEKNNILTRQEFFLLFHYFEKFKDLEYFKVDFHLSRQPKNKDFNTTETKTQNNIKFYLKEMNIEFIEEFQQDGYSYDFYIPKYNTVLEYDGPIHFYPLQTQYLEKDKFRFRMINKLYKRKLVYVPYFEWSKIEIDSFARVFLRKIIFQDSAYQNSNCFRENYYLNKIDRILI